MCHPLPCLLTHSVLLPLPSFSAGQMNTNHEHKPSWSFAENRSREKREKSHQAPGLEHTPRLPAPSSPLSAPCHPLPPPRAAPAMRVPWLCQPTKATALGASPAWRWMKAAGTGTWVDPSILSHEGRAQGAGGWPGARRGSRSASLPNNLPGAKIGDPRSTWLR